MNGYPNDPHPLASARGVLLGVLVGGGFWLAAFIAFLIYLRT